MATALRRRPTAEDHARPRRRSRPLRCALRVLVAVVAVVVLAAGGIAFLALRAPSVADAPARVAAILAAHGAPSDGGTIPAKAGAALLATEDSRFYSDPALDPQGVVRALIGFVTSNGRDGGATIELQLAKMLYAPGTSIGSELDQVGIAFRLDHRYSKRQILAMYLNAAYFGDGAYGITAASERYFGLPPDRLSWGQAALLAGLVQAPSSYDPHRHLSKALARRRHVFARLIATGVLTPAQAAADAAAPLHPAVSFSG